MFVFCRGSFNLPNGHEIYNGAFRAHPPSNVHSKVYEALHKMPENICFELLPIPDLFQGDSPYKDDIGLYFFPRYKKRFISSFFTNLIYIFWVGPPPPFHMTSNKTQHPLNQLWDKSCSFLYRLYLYTSLFLL